MGDDKQEEAQTLDEWKTLLTKDLLALKQLDGQDAFTRIRRSMKEQEIGQHCRPGQEKVWAILISPCSKRHWDSMNGNGMPTHPKFDLNTTRQTRPRQAHPPCRTHGMHLGLVKLGGAKMSKSLGKLLDNGIKIVFPKWVFSLDEPGSTIKHGVERNSVGVGFIGEGIR